MAVNDAFFMFLHINLYLDLRAFYTCTLSGLSSMSVVQSCFNGLPFQQVMNQSFLECYFSLWSVLHCCRQVCEPDRF